MSHVFVSHSSDNRELASDLAAFLEARGVRIWIAPRDVRPGMDYSEQLQLAIESAVAFVVLVTDMANKSPYVRAETEMAFGNHKPLFPVGSPTSSRRPAWPCSSRSATGPTPTGRRRAPISTGWRASCRR